MGSFRARGHVLLDAAAVAALRAEELAASLEALGRNTQDGEVIEVASQCREAAHDAVFLMVRAGAECPHPMPTVPDERLDLAELAALVALDTPEARSLLGALEELLPLAEAADASRGTDVADALQYLVLRLRDETSGPSGRE